MKRITGYDIKIIPNDQQRYETCGDWWYEDDKLTEGGSILFIRISKMQDQRQEQLVLIHELAEVILCNQQGVTQEAVDKFDMDYESARFEGDESEPGDARGAPYGTQHCFATAIERMMCAALGMAWADYEEDINALFK